MIELERDTEDPHFPGEVWASHDHMHVIVEETEDTVRCDRPYPGWYVRDEEGERGPVRTFAKAFDIAFDRWGGQVTLAPANRLREEIEEGRTGEIGDFLLQYLAAYGAAGIDVQALARRVFERIEEN